MDRNTLIGFLLLGVLFFAYFNYTMQGRKSYEQQKQATEDSLARLKPKTDTAQASGQQSDTAGFATAPVHRGINGLIQDSSATEVLSEVKTELFDLTFTNKGGQPAKVELNKYKVFDGSPLLLNDTGKNYYTYKINVGTNNTADIEDAYFTRLPDQKDGEGNQIITYALRTTEGSVIEHQYTIKPDNYMIDFNIKIKNGEQLFTDQKLRLNWQAEATQKEKDLSWEVQQSRIAYLEGDKYDYNRFNIGKDKEKKLVKPVEWVALAQQYFISSIVAKDKFESATIAYQTPEDTSGHIVGKIDANMLVSVPQSSDVTIPMQLYYGPSDYKILKQYNNEMYNIVPYGYGIISFVKYINRGFVLPVFNFLHKFISNYGIIIAILTILIRLLISPLTYQSYLSGAKMKLLKPELEELKKKFGDDKQGFAMQQMKLYRSAGANPMGGCLPAVLQIPIFFALYAFFNSDISLRGQSFLWADNLSTYDSILDFGFNIPLYGSHVSLFTLFAVVTSLLITVYGMSNMQSQDNPMMKYMPYIMPIAFLGIFNRMPAALTWYYTVSNLITLAIQVVIQHYIIDHDKLMAQLQENKKKPARKSKWQERIDAMQQQNDRIKKMKERIEANKNK